jgi:AcrR family transcriptional regulator
VVTSVTKPPPAETRRPIGRPRSERRSADVLAATLDALVDHGITGMTIEAIAAQAGVSKVTIYRRWPDKIALTLAALDSLPELTVPDTGNLLDDLRAVRRALVGAVETSPLGEVLPALMAERRRSEHRDAIRAYIDQRSRPFAIVVERAIARGEIRSALDVNLVAHLFSSPLGMSLINRERPLDDREWTAIVTTIIDGLRAQE